MGTKEFWLLLKILENLHSVPDVIAGSLDINSVGEDFSAHLRRDAETTSGIFHVGNYIIDGVLFTKFLYQVGRSLPAGFPADIGYE